MISQWQLRTVSYLRQLLLTTFRLYKRGTGYCATYHACMKKKNQKNNRTLDLSSMIHSLSCISTPPVSWRIHFMSEDTHALTDLPLVWIHGRNNTSASKCFHFFSLFFSSSPSGVLLIWLWLHKSPPAVEGVRQLELRQGNGSGVSAPRVTGQILNDDTRQCARRNKKKVNRQAEKNVGRFNGTFLADRRSCAGRVYFINRVVHLLSAN